MGFKVCSTICSQQKALDQRKSTLWEGEAELGMRERDHAAKVEREKPEIDRVSKVLGPAGNAAELSEAMPLNCRLILPVVEGDIGAEGGGRACVGGQSGTDLSLSIPRHQMSNDALFHF